MAPAQQQGPGATLQGLVVLGVIAGALYLTGIVDFGGINESTASPPVRSPAAERRSASIEAGIRDFKKDLPFLVDEGISEEQREDARHFVWKAGADSIASENSWVRFLDANSDGSLDEIGAGLVFPDGPQAKQVAAMGIACRLVTVASGNRVDAEVVARWLVESQGELARTREGSLSRTFGPVAVELSLLQIDGVAGAVILLGIRPSHAHAQRVVRQPGSGARTERAASSVAVVGSAGDARSPADVSREQTAKQKPVVMFLGYLHNVFTVGLKEGVAQVELRDLQGQLIEVKKMAAEGQFRMRHAPNVIRARVWIDDGPAETFTLAQGETQEPFAQRLRDEFENRVREQRRAAYEREWNR